MRRCCGEVSLRRSPISPQNYRLTVKQDGKLSSFRDIIWDNNIQKETILPLVCCLRIGSLEQLVRRLSIRAILNCRLGSGWSHWVLESQGASWWIRKADVGILVKAIGGVVLSLVSCIWQLNKTRCGSSCCRCGCRRA